MANVITIDIDTLESELKAQELYLSEAQWMGIIASIRQAEVVE